MRRMGVGDNKKYFLTKWGEETACILCSKRIPREAYSVGIEGGETPPSPRRVCVHCAIDVGELGKEARRENE